MPANIKYTCPPNITSFSQCIFPDGVTHVYCYNNQINSFQYLPGSVREIHCINNQITSFQYLPGSVSIIYCRYNQINSFQYLPGSITDIDCGHNQINSFQYLPGSVRWVSCYNNPCDAELRSKGLSQIYQENKDIIIYHVCRWKVGIEKLRYMRLNYMVNNLWKRYWYDQRDVQGYSRACRYNAAKNCPNGFLTMT